MHMVHMARCVVLPPRAHGHTHPTHTACQKAGWSHHKVICPREAHAAAWMPPPNAKAVQQCCQLGGSSCIRNSLDAMFSSLAERGLAPVLDEGLRMPASGSSTGATASKEAAATNSTLHSVLAGQLLAGSPLVMQEFEGSGHGLVAGRALRTGALLIEDTPLAAVPQKAYAEAVCHQCFEPLAAKKATWCKDCRASVWCSPQCAALARESHGIECRMLQQFPPQKRSQLHGIRLFVQLATAGDQAREALGMHDNTAAMPNSASMADGINSVLPPDLRVPRGEMIDLISKVHTNTYFVTDMEGRRLGSGYYPAMSLFNHSCDPNAVAGFTKGRAHVRAIRPISRGEQVCLSYTELYRPAEARSKTLQSSKGFTCTCARCEAAAYGETIAALVCGTSNCQGHALLSGSPVDGAGGKEAAVCGMCGAQRKEPAAALRDVDVKTQRLTAEAGVYMGQQQWPAAVKLLQSALKLSEGTLHPLHYARFEAHVMLVDVLSLQPQLDTKLLYTNIRVVPHLWDATCQPSFPPMSLS